MRSNSRKITLIGILIVLFLLYLYYIVPSVISWGPSNNYENVTVKTTVNVTQSYPEILNIACVNSSGITLNAGTSTSVNCSIDIRDFNGGDTINNTNGTFYYYLNASSDPDDNNTHYTNATCTEDANDGFFANWTCFFDVMYYANNGTWVANFTVMDNHNFTDNGNTTAIIYELFALNVTGVIDFGNMAVGDTTGTPVPANITNFGNMDINVSIYGFGGEDDVAYAGLAMVCDQRNISLSNERFAINDTATYAEMYQVTGAATPIPGLLVLQQTSETVQVINTTYWRLHVNQTTNPFGVCNGTVIFSAEAP
ncbi:MAG: hypothetical protein KKF46_03870 [Nanoarchaeota archaeon]|nr:hypothetical protein [Nanoarchaeota archaeon]MBU1321472.1 hypothetical protein [Nanoarchaeota archaeon]MBU1598202.1 hypothetical protein [Nanoarchaeota archaeon]MBU2442100.1 hypothetical protein [Nanoarchaeota archaeon]